MRYIERWGLMRSSIPENVQEHSHMVAVLAHALGLAAAALYHDAPEILTGDMPTPIKYHSGRISEAYHEVEHVAASKLIEMLPVELRGEFEPLISGEVGDDAKALIKAADRLSAYIKCIEERKAGNNEFISAEKQTRAILDASPLPEVKYFLDKFIPAFELTLDELGTIDEEGKA